MSEWIEHSLGEVCSRLRSGSNITAKDIHQSGSFPVFGGNGIRGYAAEANFSGECAIIGRQGAYCGNVRYFTGEARMSEHAIVACAGPSHHTRFLAYLLSNMNLGSLSGQAAQPGLSVKVLSQQSVWMPSRQNQERIAEILGAYDDLIEVNRRRVAVLEEMARGLFEEWFVRFRFPGHESVAIVDTPDGRLPEGWRLSTLREVANINRASLKPKQAPEQIGYIDIASVSPGRIDSVNWIDFSDAPGRARRLVRDGSILWSNVRPNRRSHAMVLSPEPNTIASTGFTVLDSMAVPFTYLYQWVTTDDFVGYLVGNASGAAYPAVTASTFERAPIVLPPADLLEQFGAFAGPLCRLSETLRQASERLAASRDLLLPLLISGQLSVEGAERELEHAA